MFRPLLQRLAPLRRHFCAAAAAPRELPPFPQHTPSIPTSVHGPVAPGTYGSLAHVKRRYDEDGRGELIKTAQARRLGVAISHRKLNVVARFVRGLPVDEAFRQLSVCNKRASPIIAATLTAAIKNANAFAFRRDRLVVHEAWVGKGCYIRKIRPYHGKGRYGIEHKKYAHLTVVVRELDDELWEEKCMPQYIYKPRRDAQSHDNHPIHKSDRVSWVSDLDIGFRAAQENIVGLKIALEEANAGATANTSPKEVA